MIPIKDVNPSKRFPVVSVSIIAICSIIWLYEWSLMPKTPTPAFVPGFLNDFEIFIRKYGLVPSDILEKPYTLLTHMFLHGSWMHLIGNMWFLWIFADNVEDKLGRLKFLLFYLLCGLGAAGLQIIVSFLFGGSDVPMVGASGAISGVLGAYLRLFPHAKILALVPVFFLATFVEVPAIVFISLWFLIQIVNGIITLPFIGYGGVAWYAHIGGFLAGFFLINLMRRREYYI